MARKIIGVLVFLAAMLIIVIALMKLGVGIG